MHQCNSQSAVPQSQHQYSNPLNAYNTQTDYTNGSSSFGTSLVNNYGESPSKEEKPKSTHYPVVHCVNGQTVNALGSAAVCSLHPTNQNLSCLSSSNCSNFSTSSSNSSLENSTFHPSLHSSHYYYSRQQHHARSSASFNASTSPRSLISNSYPCKVNANGTPIYTSASSYYHFHQQLSAQSESSSLSSSSSIDYSHQSQHVNQTPAEDDYSAAFYKQHLLMNDPKTDYISPGDHHSQMTYNDYQLSNSKDNFSLNVSNYFIVMIIVVTIDN